jgi:ech hydrogenase subunit D
MLKHFKLSIAKGVPVPSITPVYYAAFLVENEIQDLFGIAFEGLALDYERTLYLDEEVRATPFCRFTVAKAARNE